GRAELGALRTTPLHLRAEIRDLTIHGREATGEVPYAHVGRLLAELKIISLLETEFGFNSVVLEHPVIHIVTYSDGSTNQPQPVLLRASGRNPIEELFALSIDNLELRRGEFSWDKRSIPLDFVAHDVSTDMRYSLGRKSTRLNATHPTIPPYPTLYLSRHPHGHLFRWKHNSAAARAAPSFGKKPD